MRWNKKILPILSIFCIAVFLCTSCYHFESKQIEEYETFRQNMVKKRVCEFLPKLENTSFIEDMYLFYSDRDFLDSFYTIYLNCVFTEAEYRKEYEKIANLYTDADLLTINSDSFNYNSMSYGNIFEPDSFDIGVMIYEYVLFDESEYRIVYVTFFEKELNGKSKNIPEKYLPKELVDLRNSSKQ